MSDFVLQQGDCVEVMAHLDDNSVDAVVCDPPYGLEFMGKDWDAPWKDARTDKRGVIDPKQWGGNQDSPNGGNPYSRARIRTAAAHYAGDAAEVGRAFQAWCMTWSKEALRVLKPGGHLVAFGGSRTYHRLACAIEDAGFEIRDSLMWLYGTGFPKSKNLDGEWEGWGTALKPAHEPIVLARKPPDGSVTANVTKYGTGALNIDGCRLPTDENLKGGAYSGKPRLSDLPGAERSATAAGMFGVGKALDPDSYEAPIGRWPANVLMDEEAGAQLDLQSNGASRFFYCAKASKKERGEANNHPTVKPVAVMEWLVRLVTPPAGVVLDPFMGSGSTGVAARGLGFRFIGIEKDPQYVQTAQRRIGEET